MRARPKTFVSSPSTRTVVAFVAIAFGLGCGGGGGNGGTTNPPPPPPAGGFTLTGTSAGVSVARGATQTVTVTISRTGSFTDAVSLTASGFPAGVTGSFSPSPIPTGQTTSTLTLSASASAATGTVTVTITGSANGVTSQTTALQLTVTSPPAQTGPFTMSISATSYLVYPSNQTFTSPIITLVRNAGFAGNVSFTTTGLPSTLFVGFTPSSTTGNTTTAVVVNVGAPNGTYTATITGASAQGNQTVTLQIVVAPPSTGSIKWKFCSGSLTRYFVAVRDGTGPWTRLMPANDTSYSFTISSGKGELAYVNLDSGGYRVSVYQYTAQEMAARAASQCKLVQNVTTRTANGTFGGVTGFRVAQVGMGWWFGSANGNGSFSLLNLPPGPLDVIAARQADFIDPSAMPVDRLIIRRAQNPASGASMPVLDFGAAESFAPTVATWTFLNTTGQSFGVTQMFTTAGGSTGILASQPGIDGAATNRAVYGVPLAQTQAGDLHQLIATVATVAPTANNPVRATRQIIYYGRTLGVPDTLTFGPVMPAATVAPVVAGRLRAQGTLPTEYNTGVSFDVTQTTTARFFSIHATRGFLGAGNSYDLQMPDLSGAIGWDTQYAIRTGVPTNWAVSGGGPTLDFFDVRNVFNSTRALWTGAMTGVVAPADGATYYMGRTFGTATP
ncbi:MAG TPA: hypothetical protein VF128_14540 [Gemmatimonadaceae bacterium]